MVGSLVLGIGLALGHHFYYMNWNDRVVQNSDEQQWVARIGTGFAFLVKMFLAIATCTAYVQQLWLDMTGRPVTIENADSLFAVLTNANEFWDLRCWIYRPFLVLLALVTWLVLSLSSVTENSDSPRLIPFAAVITPATLSVHAALQNSTVTGAYLNFSDPGFAVVWHGNEYYRSNYERPDILVSRLTLATAVQGSILSIPPPLPNSSYTLEFNGPSLKCDDANSTVREIFYHTLKPWMISNSNAVMVYGAWVGADMLRLNLTDFLDGNADPPFSLDTGNPNQTAIYIAANRDPEKGLVYKSWMENFDSYMDWTLLKCVLQNVSYVVDVDLHDKNVQLVKVKKKEFLNDVPGLDSGSHLTNDSVEAISYQSIMDCLGTVLVGFATSPIRPVSAPEKHSTHPLSIYLTQLLLTSLVDATDFQGDFFFEIGVNGSSTEASMLSRPKNWFLKDGVEELFENMTLSLLSNPRFQ